MRINWTYFVVAMGMGGWLLLASGTRLGDPVQLAYPSSWPKPVYDFSRNPLTQAGIDLGRRLFYDPVLSRDSTISCSSCHLSYTAFTHVDHALSHGVSDRIGRRNSPALMNLAWAKSFMWDGAINHLDMQAMAPISDFSEMDETLGHVVQKLGKSEQYRGLFAACYGDSAITGERVLKALSQFELTLVSCNSKYDRVKEGKEQFSEQEANGYRLFQENCSSCHAEPLFTTYGYAWNGLPVDTTLKDFGRLRVTQAPEDSLHFKIPSLRNVEFSYPYMHDGRFKQLREVILYYSQSNHQQQKIELSANERVDLLAFLLTLTDKSFLYNQGFGYPRD